MNHCRVALRCALYPVVDEVYFFIDIKWSFELRTSRLCFESRENKALYPVQDSGLYALKGNFYCDVMGVVTQPASRLGLLDM